MKSIYEAPLAELLLLSDEDVLTASDGDEIWTPFV